MYSAVYWCLDDVCRSRSSDTQRWIRVVPVLKCSLLNKTRYVHIFHHCTMQSSAIYTYPYTYPYPYTHTHKHIITRNSASTWCRYDLHTHISITHKKIHATMSPNSCFHTHHQCPLYLAGLLTTAFIIDSLFKTLTQLFVSILWRIRGKKKTHFCIQSLQKRVSENHNVCKQNRPMSISSYINDQWSSDQNRWLWKKTHTHFWWRYCSIRFSAN